MRSRKNRGLAALFGVVSLAFGVTGAEAAQGSITGAGAGVGYEQGGNIVQQCPQPLFGTINKSKFKLTHTGTYDGVAAAVPPVVATYVGPTELNLESDPYVISPEGTYVTCTLPGVIPIRGSLTSTSPTAGQFNCGSLSGTWQRRAFEVVEFRLAGTCTVASSTGTQAVTGNTFHVVTGTMSPCPVPDEPPIPAEIPNETQCGEIRGPDYSSILTTAHEVTPLP